MVPADTGVPGAEANAGPLPQWNINGDPLSLASYALKGWLLMAYELDALALTGQRSDIPDFGSGDTVRVHAKVVEGDKERIQVFEGVVIRKRMKGLVSNFTVRKIASGVGVERTFPMNSPRVDKVEVMRRGKVRRKNLYYLRGLTGKAARIKEKRF